MAALSPYTFIQCPCSNIATFSASPPTRSPAGLSSGLGAVPSPTDPRPRPLETRISLDPGSDGAGRGVFPETDYAVDVDPDADDGTFDPRAPRSNFSLYPLEYLLYCEDCHQIRCPRCVAEEIVTYYCPSCLFEVPSSNLKSEGNRCTRSCFQCPVCIGGPLVVTTVEPPANQRLAAGPDPKLASSSAASSGGPWILACSYCMWSTAEVGIKFDKPNGIYGQLLRIRNGGTTRMTARERKDERRREAVSTATVPRITDPVPEEDEDEDEDEEGEQGAGKEEKAGGRAAAAAAAASDKTKGGHGLGRQDRPEHLDVEAQFANLRSFYQAQSADAAAGGAGGAGGGLSSLGLGDHLGYASPTSLSRIMSIYTGGGGGGDATTAASKRPRPGTTAAREAAGPREGLQISNLDESAAIARLRSQGLAGTTSAQQRVHQPATSHVGKPVSGGDWEQDNHGDGTEAGHGHSHHAGRGLGGCGNARHQHFATDLRPVPVLLRTKRSKRCPVCRHIISKPEAKVQSTRFKIRLVAGSYVPTIVVQPLQLGGLGSPDLGGQRGSIQGLPAAASGSSARNSFQHSNNRYHSGAPATLLRPHQPLQFLLTFKNPIFEPVRITLATPSTTPGRFPAKVTVLCPQFEIGANVDTWDETLINPAASAADDGGSGTAGDRLSRRATLMGGGSSSNRNSTTGGPNQPEAGKIWERGRNWVTVVLEVVPPSLRGPGVRLNSLSSVAGGIGSPPGRLGSVSGIGGALGSPPGRLGSVSSIAGAAAAAATGATGATSGNGGTTNAGGPPKDDEDLLEIPMFVRIEWEADAGGDDGTTSGHGGGVGGGIAGSGGREKEGREKRELAYWTVLGLGRIADE